MNETVLVTGGTGFVASWCIVELLNRGYQVRTTIRSAAKEALLRQMIARASDAGDRLSVYVADLTADAGWDTAVAGVDFVLHVASPLGGNNLNDEDSFIVPARDGALRVLRAADRAKVKRVVMTSSCAAASPDMRLKASFNDEQVWADPEDRTLNAYRKSKIISELAAWQYISDHPSAMTLTTLLPSAIFGPVLTPDNLGSVQVIGRLLQGRVRGNPQVGFNIVDVRDLADLHIRAMTAPEAAGQRFIAANDYLWMAEISRLLRAKLGNAASKVPTRMLPSVILRLAALFDPSLRLITQSLGRQHQYSSAKAQQVLGWQPRPATGTVIDCAESLIQQGAV